MFRCTITGWYDRVSQGKKKGTFTGGRPIFVCFNRMSCDNFFRINNFFYINCATIHMLLRTPVCGHLGVHGVMVGYLPTCITFLRGRYGNSFVGLIVHGRSEGTLWGLRFHFAHRSFLLLRFVFFVM